MFRVEPHPADTHDYMPLSQECDEFSRIKGAAESVVPCMWVHVQSLLST